MKLGSSGSLAERYKVRSDPHSGYLCGNCVDASRYNVPRMLRGYKNSVFDFASALYRHIDGEDAYSRNNGPLIAYKL